MTGVEKNHGDKEFIKYLRKYLEAGSNSQMPLHSIYKKRGQAYAFLNFSSLEEKNQFSELFFSVMQPQIQVQKRINLKDAINIKKIDNLPFR